MTANLVGLHPAVHAAVSAMLADPDAQAMGLSVFSAYRDPDLQARLFADAVHKYGSEAKARKWVAPPFHSNHGPVLNDDGSRVPYGPPGGKWGCAVDLAVSGVTADAAGQWPDGVVARVSAVAARYGLHQAMPWEDWHYEPVANFDYTPHPAPPPTDPEEAELMGAKDDIIARIDATKNYVDGRLNNMEADLVGRLQDIEKHITDLIKSKG